MDMAFSFRNMAEELRALAVHAKDDRTREGLLHAAENYDRVATTYEVIETSKTRIRHSGA
jgi:hypothetical protein